MDFGNNWNWRGSDVHHYPRAQREQGAVVLKRRILTHVFQVMARTEGAARARYDNAFDLSVFRDSQEFHFKCSKKLLRQAVHRSGAIQLQSYDARLVAAY
ncbi:hypothetical protein CBM2586_B130574 [Cupriavidus phytorum]|uniref:Uncharacterized protein n=1 Tax=Cupriavidus taiwanensis TaxID=164546 RepID=A0A976AAQ0_9BURK|nr:hypothetical protein CBM2586_B130574 [Cupriavidus taiwanensis]